ncbi:hypothetical protein SDC9_146158 [bioreactor metagenome]|uniref:Uncharacterized protein n=1 Tax=bioreactor metagenome TaxID=1076179 RepID=A0A645ECZ5_9ZZZZ
MRRRQSPKGKIGRSRGRAGILRPPVGTIRFFAACEIEIDHTGADGETDGCGCYAALGRKPDGGFLCPAGRSTPSPSKQSDETGQ